MTTGRTGLAVDEKQHTSVAACRRSHEIYIICIMRNAEWVARFFSATLRRLSARRVLAGVVHLSIEATAEIVGAFQTNANKFLLSPSFRSSANLHLVWHRVRRRIDVVITGFSLALPAKPESIAVSL